jgi:hypothetical protein
MRPFRVSSHTGATLALYRIEEIRMADHSARPAGREGLAADIWATAGGLAVAALHAYFLKLAIARRLQR